MITLTGKQMQDKGFALLEEYNLMIDEWSALKATSEALKKDEDALLAKEADTYVSGSEAERMRRARASVAYDEFRGLRKDTNEAYYKKDMRRKNIEMGMDFLRSAMKGEREMVERAK